MEYFENLYMSSLTSKKCKQPIYYANELWANCSSVFPELKDWYFISNFGRIYSSHSDILMNQNIDPNGYYRITLMKNDGKSTRKSVHRLVLTAFNWFEGCEEYEVNHIDGDRLNNWVGNLEWVTKSENLLHSCEIGLLAYGEDAANAKHSDDKIIQIANLLERTDLTFDEISYIVFGNCDNSHHKLYHSIIHGHSWARVIGERDFSNRYSMHFHPYASDTEFSHLYPHYQTISDNILYDIYSYHIDNPHVIPRVLAELFIPGFELLERNIQLSRIRSIRSLINNVAFAHIREKYNRDHNILIESSTASQK